MTRWCSFCDIRGHNSSECWWKPNHIKEINKEDGKWKKKYNLPAKSTPINRDEKYTKQKRKTRTPSPIRKPETKPKQQANRFTKQKSKSPEKHLHGEIQVIEVINQPITKSKCKDCIKWDIRMQQTLKYQQEAKIDHNQIVASKEKIIKSLSDRIIKLQQEKECYKRLYELNNK